MFRSVFLIIISVVVSSCGGSSSEEQPQDNVVSVAVPTNLSSNVVDGKVILEWNNTTPGATTDLYLSTDDSLNYRSYTTSDNSQWIRGVDSPYEYTPPSYGFRYFFTVVAKVSDSESEQAALVSAVPRYTDKGATVEDLFTSLEWQKCAIGQTYNSAENTCEGDATRTSFVGAQAEINQNYAQFGWRLPTVGELVSLIYCTGGEPDYFTQVDGTNALCSSNTEEDGPYIFEPIFQGIDTTSSYKTTSIFSPSGNYLFVNFRRAGTNAASEPTFTFFRLVRPM